MLAGPFFFFELLEASTGRLPRAPDDDPGGAGEAAAPEAEACGVELSCRLKAYSIKITWSGR